MMSPMAVSDVSVYLNGEYVPLSDAFVSIDDRGFLFADACYEVTSVVDGRCIALDRHLQRLQDGLDAIRIEFDAASLASVHEELIRRNGLREVPRGSVYVHVTRGVAPRSHAFPVGVEPTVLVRAQQIAGLPASVLEHGTKAVTAPDIRWGRADIKTTGLLPNVLAEQAAIDRGANDVVFVRGDEVVEGSHTNVFGVIDGVLVTAPADHRILAGVTRGIVLELARDVGVDVEERTWTVAELAAADEVLMTSTTAGVRPIVAVDGRPIGDGARGPVTARLQHAYGRFVSSHATG